MAGTLTHERPFWRRKGAGIDFSINGKLIGNTDRQYIGKLLLIFHILDIIRLCSVIYF
jgi:hypothetical protein